ncbi:VanZ family protein [Peribacillus frigoritolerans]|uniref:VanZ family protein n=1 Tax=Peribacillus frigoritolerans TaxID=450367 RepID=UPI00105A5615|nr:VanZ family protein [Peribacillus frigoritolerans]TDL79020.1 VanZ family protein [Peribacillus frigoritolerans]
MKKSFSKWMLTLAPILYMILIWILSSMPADAIINTPFSFDRLMKESLHLIEFGILYWLIALAFAAHQSWTVKASILAAGVSILYGATDEIHQYFVPYRSATVIDLVKDTIGVLVSFYMMKVTYFKKRPSFITSIFQKLNDAE